MPTEDAPIYKQVRDMNKTGSRARKQAARDEPQVPRPPMAKKPSKALGVGTSPVLTARKDSARRRKFTAPKSPEGK